MANILVMEFINSTQRISRTPSRSWFVSVHEILDHVMAQSLSRTPDLHACCTKRSHVWCLPSWQNYEKLVKVRFITSHSSQNFLVFETFAIAPQNRGHTTASPPWLSPSSESLSVGSRLMFALSRKPFIYTTFPKRKYVACISPQLLFIVQVFCSVYTRRQGNLSRTQKHRRKTRMYKE